MPTTWKKSKLGKQDILFDDAGTNATAAVEKSDGTTRTVSKLNASHTPILATTRDQLTADNTKFSATNVDAAIKELAAELNLIGIPDGTILEFAAGVLQIANDSITQAKMADNSIDSEQYIDGSIDAVHLVADIIDGTKLADNAVNSEHYTDASIDNEHYADNSVGIEELNLDDEGNSPTAFPIFSGKKTWDAGVATTQTISVTGAAETDTVIANFQNVNASGVAIESAYVSSAGTLTIICDGTAQDGDIVGYLVFRPTIAVV